MSSAHVVYTMVKVFTRRLVNIKTLCFDSSTRSEVKFLKVDTTKGVR